MPSGWHKTWDDVLAEMQPGESVGRPEMAWAQEYERSMLPGGLRFPRLGDVYEPLEDMTVTYMTQWLAPYTGGGDGVLKKTDRLVVEFEPGDDSPLGASLRAVDYPALEERMIPASDRQSPTWAGFRFYIKTIDLNRKYRLVHEG
jgi:hypothetical protein